MHCSPGIHRTGMIVYALLRYLQISKEEALQKLKLMRDITFQEVKESRLIWGDKFGNEVI